VSANDNDETGRVKAFTRIFHAYSFGLEPDNCAVDGAAGRNYKGR